MASDGDVWHLVEARRDDGTPAMFRIRDLEPRLDQPRIFVVEMPYPPTELSRLPDAGAYRRAAQFEEQWLAPACAALDWTFVAQKTEDGSFFLYLYGSADPLPMIEKLSPFDGSLGFFDEHDPQWGEYAALRELLDQAHAMPPETPEPTPPAEAATTKPATTRPAAAKPAASKPAATKPLARTSAATQPPAKKPPAKKSPAKKSPAKKPAAKKSPAKKSPAKKPAAKKPQAKKAAAKKPAAKKLAAKRAR